MRIVGIVLAAGSGSRMGRPKQLLPVGGVPMVARVVADAVAADLDDVVVVTGHHGEDVEAVLTGRVVTVARNPDPERGNLSSLRVGLEAAGPADAIVLLLGDMPDVGVEVIDAMVRRWRDERCWAAVAEYRGRRAHPLVLSAAALEGLHRLSGPKPLWRYLGEEAPETVVAVPFDRRPPADVDTPQDYARLRGADPAAALGGEPGVASEVERRVEGPAECEPVEGAE